MTAPAIDTNRCHADAARGVDAAVGGRGYWYGYFMTGVPVAMS